MDESNRVIQESQSTTILKKHPDLKQAYLNTVHAVADAVILWELYYKTPDSISLEKADSIARQLNKTLKSCQLMNTCVKAVDTELLAAAVELDLTHCMFLESASYVEQALNGYGISYLSSDLEDIQANHIIETWDAILARLGESPDLYTEFKLEPKIGDANFLEFKKRIQWPLLKQVLKAVELRNLPSSSPQDEFRYIGTGTLTQLGEALHPEPGKTAKAYRDFLKDQMCRGNIRYDSSESKPALFIKDPRLVSSVQKKLTAIQSL